MRLISTAILLTAFWGCKKQSEGDEVALSHARDTGLTSSTKSTAGKDQISAKMGDGSTGKSGLVVKVARGGPTSDNFKTKGENPFALGFDGNYKEQESIADEQKAIDWRWNSGKAPPLGFHEDTDSGIGSDLDENDYERQTVPRPILAIEPSKKDTGIPSFYASSDDLLPEQTGPNREVFETVYRWTPEQADSDLNEVEVFLKTTVEPSIAVAIMVNSDVADMERVIFEGLDERLANVRMSDNERDRVFAKLAAMKSGIQKGVDLKHQVRRTFAEYILAEKQFADNRPASAGQLEKAVDVLTKQVETLIADFKHKSDGEWVEELGSMLNGFTMHQKEYLMTAADAIRTSKIARDLYEMIEAGLAVMIPLATVYRQSTKKVLDSGHLAEKLVTANRYLYPAPTGKFRDHVREELIAEVARILSK